VSSYLRYWQAPTAEQLLAAVSQLNGLNQEISSSVREQSHVAVEINKNISRINSNSDRNHVRIEETLRSAEEVSQLTEEIKR